MRKRRADPSGSPVKEARILLDKEISLDTAKLLGVPFTFGGCCVAVKYVHTPSGLVKLGRVLIAGYTNNYPKVWREEYSAQLDVEGAAKRCMLHPVRFDDEPINWD